MQKHYPNHWLSKLASYVFVACVTGFAYYVFVKPTSFLSFGRAIALGAIVLLLQLALVGGKLSFWGVRHNMERVGLKAHNGDYPYLVCDAPDLVFPNGRILTFQTNGIPKEDWEKRQAQLESGFNLFISAIEEGKDRRHVVLYAVPASQGLPKRITWTRDMLSVKEFVLVLGQGLSGLITIDMQKVPHILVGGSTGSGKSVLLKLLLHQCLEKGSQVILADFKGGVDYNQEWHQRTTMLFNIDTLIPTLKELTDTLEARKMALKQSGHPNIVMYNEHTEDGFQRIIFACDEIAELLDKTSLKKEEKEKIDTIIGYLSTIARQGRAFGIHLILATQRPDATILPGQIKNNLDCRICGRADQVLSQIVLDTVDAHERISKSAQGRFITNDGVLFQGFWLDSL